MTRAGGSVVGQAMTAISRGNWDELKPLLHPYLHWRCADGRVIRGRTNVLAYLAATPVGEPPQGHELRDGQIYRWTESS
jgi:hypothetical protein